MTCRWARVGRPGYTEWTTPTPSIAGASGHIRPAALWRLWTPHGHGVPRRSPAGTDHHRPRPDPGDRRRWRRVLPGQPGEPAGRAAAAPEGRGRGRGARDPGAPGDRGGG